jgi:DNA-binding protein
MTISNKNGNESGKMTYIVSDSKKNGSSIISRVNSEFVDAKGKSISKAANNVKCENGVMQMDMKTFIPPVQLEQIKTGSATANDVYLEYPANMNVGDQLKDGQLNMDYESINGLKCSLEISITERKVEGKETVTTLAGTWECYKISANNKITSRISGIGIPIKMNVTEWFAPGFGIIKTESKGGKTEITSVK